MIESLTSLLCLAALISLAYAIGWLVLRPLKAWNSTLEKLIFSIPIGAGCVSYFLLACGLLKQFRPPLFYGLLGLGILVSPLMILDLLPGRRISGALKDAAGSRLYIACGIVLAIIGICTVIAALAPPTQWDALSYQLAGPKTFLREGRIFYVPYDHHTNFPFTLQMLYVLMLGVGNVGGAQLCHWLCGALLTASVHAFAVRHIGPAPRGSRIGIVAAVIVASTPMVLWESTVAYSDLSTALFTWLSLFAMMNSYQAEREAAGGVSPNASDVSSQCWLVLSASLMGFALGTKFTVIAFWGFLLVGLVVAGWRKTRSITPALIRRAALWAVISLCIASPWYIKTFLYTGNPTYPFLYGLFGGRYWTAANAAQYTRDQATLGMGKSAISLLLAPWQATMAPTANTFTEYGTFNLSPVFLGLLPIAAMSGRRLSRQSVIIGAFALCVTAFWFFSVQQTRYLLPAIPAFAIVCAEAAVALFEGERDYAGYFPPALIGLAAIWGIYLASGLTFFGLVDADGNRLARGVWPVVTGQETRSDFVDRHVPGVGLAVHWINANTPPDAKVALFDTTFGFYLDRQYMWAQPDHAHGLNPWDSYAGVDDWLADFKRRGYTTLLTGAREPDAKDDGERWRTLLADAVRDGKVHEVFSAPHHMSPQADGTRVPVFVTVYRIP